MKTLRIDECELCTREYRYNKETEERYEYEVPNGEMMHIYIDHYEKYFKIIDIDFDPYNEDDDRCTEVNVTFNEDRSEGYMNIGIADKDGEKYDWKTLYIKAISGKINKTRIYEVIVVDFAD